MPFTNCEASFISPLNKVLKFRVGGKQASLLVGGTHERHGRLYTIEVKSSQVTSLTFMLPRRSRTLVCKARAHSLVTCAWELNADPKRQRGASGLLFFMIIIGPDSQVWELNDGL